MAGTCSYPHPVLGNLDDVDGNVDFRISVVVDDHVRITGSFDVQNKDVEDLLERGEAVRILRCTCRRTYMRSTHVVPDVNFEIEIDKKDVFGEVRVEPFVVSKRAVTGYAPKTMNSEYGSATFDLTAGQVVATGSLIRFDPETDYDPLRNTGASLIQIGPGGTESEPYEVDYALDRILIRISDAALRNYQGVKSRVPMMIILALVVPVLAEALRKMGRDEGDEFAAYRWYQRLEMILATRGIDLPVDDPLSVAQSLVGNPLDGALKDLDEQLHGDDD